MKKYKKTKKKRKKKKIVLNRKQIIILSAFASLIMVLFFIFMFVVIGSYKGLGIPQEIKSNNYNMSTIYYENGLMKYEDENYYSVNGIDVSTYQKEVNWNKVKAAGIDFVMIRLGYSGWDTGEIVMDDRFKENLKGAKDAGLDVGIYFFSQAISIDEAEAEAKYVIRHIRGEGVNYPVAFDMEPVSEVGRIASLTRTQKTEICDAFCSIIEANGHKAMVYGNPTWLNQNIDLSYLTRYSVWLAHYDESTYYQNEFSIWQYSNTGKLPGIEGNVDINIMFIKK